MEETGGRAPEPDFPFELARRLADAERALAEQGLQLAAARAREVLLDRLARIQRQITRRSGLQETLDAVTAGAHELLKDEIVVLFLVDPEVPGSVSVTSSIGLDGSTPRRSLGDGIVSRCISSARMVTARTNGEELDGARIAMASPVIEDGRVSGCLVVATHNTTRRYSHTEHDALISFADHAGRALTDAHATEAALHQALHDPLTELPNRALFLDRITHAISASRRDPTRIGLLVIDIDRFRSLNDTLGHAGGDAILREVAARLRGCLRAGDTAARLGGDQFGIIVTDAWQESDITPVAQRVMEAMQAPVRAGGRQMSLTASIGIAMANDVDDADALVRNADVARRAARVHGRGHYEIFDPSMRTSVSARVELEADLHAALEDIEGDGNFSVVYQPIVALDSGGVASFEALVRWDHPERGLLMPESFIPLAEESSLIVPVGRFVLRRALRDLRAWRDQHQGMELSVSVNLSPSEFGEPTLVEDVVRALSDAGVPASSLILEITESVFLRDAEETTAKLCALHEAGVRLAIDDFGTGYSSLGYLRRFPVDIIKIDKSFIDGVAGDADDAALARAIVKLGHMLRLQVVAEGIERVEQLDRLRALRCQFGQGFHLSPPLARAAVAEYLATVRTPAALSSAG